MVLLDNNNQIAWEQWSTRDNVTIVHGMANSRVNFLSFRGSGSGSYARYGAAL